MQITRENAIAHVAKGQASRIIAGQITPWLDSIDSPHCKLDELAGDDVERLATAAKLQGCLLVLRDIAFELGNQYGFRPEGDLVALKKAMMQAAMQAADEG